MFPPNNRLTIIKMKLKSSIESKSFKHQLLSVSSKLFQEWLYRVPCVLGLGCVPLCDPGDCSLPGSSVHGVFQARILERVAISFSKESSRPRDRTRVSCVFCIGQQILYCLSPQGSPNIQLGMLRKQSKQKENKSTVMEACIGCVWMSSQWSKLKKIERKIRSSSGLYPKV